MSKNQTRVGKTVRQEMAMVVGLSSRIHRVICPVIVLAIAGTVTCERGYARPPGKYGTERLIYSFTGGQDGEIPYGTLAFSKGNLVGTTYDGGSGNQGTVFKLTKHGELTTLHSWTGGNLDGEYVTSGVVADEQGNLYGTTGYGGTSNWGIIYKLDTTGNLTVLHSFGGCADGGLPIYSNLILSKGNLYGVTSSGGEQTCREYWGTVFKSSTAGKYKLLHTFAYVNGQVNPDGYNPVGSVALLNGLVYGTTQAGGTAGWGTAFQMGPGKNESALYSFQNGSDGIIPAGGLILGKDGRFYGTTEEGGAPEFGTVFAVDSAGTETVLHTFTGTGSDGAYPVAGLVQDAAGNLYGTTQQGGKEGNGTVFEVATDGKFATLHSFMSGTTDGQLPFAGLAIDTNGDLYGTTEVGGTYGVGAVFRVKPRS
jgi:uncharacterized repeat protein (TIGR03803 family)